MVKIVNILSLIDKNIKGLNNIRKCDRLIITGSRYHSLYFQNNPKQTQIIKLVKNIYFHFKNKPVLGICYGMQLLMILNGSKIEFNIDGKRNKGSIPVAIQTKNKIFKNLSAIEIFDFNHKFSCLLKDIPNNFKIIAMSHLLVSGVSHQNKPHYGVMFHPERSGVAGDKILLNFLQ